MASGMLKIPAMSTKSIVAASVVCAAAIAGVIKLSHCAPASKLIPISTGPVTVQVKDAGQVAQVQVSPSTRPGAQDAGQVDGLALVCIAMAEEKDRCELAMARACAAYADLFQTRYPDRKVRASMDSRVPDFDQLSEALGVHLCHPSIP